MKQTAIATPTQRVSIVTRTAAVLALAYVASMTIAAPALANGSEKQVITLTCVQASYDVTVWGNGTWAPARDNNSTLVFHPTAFGERTDTFYPADGGPAETHTAPAHEFQTQPRNGHATFDCTFQLEDTDASGTYVHSGSVSGYFSGMSTN